MLECKNPAGQTSAATCQWSGGTLAGGADIPATAPVIFIDYPRIAIHAQGEHLKIDNVHIEGVGIGVYVVESDGRSHVTISNVNIWLMNDADQAYVGDPDGQNVLMPSLARQKATWPWLWALREPLYWNYSCGVLLSKAPGSYDEDYKNAKDSVTITGLFARSGQYLLRDAMYDHEVTAYGGLTRNYPGGAIAFYSRCDAIMPAAGTPPDASYSGSYANDPQAKVYFIGPVT